MLDQFDRDLRRCSVCHDQCYFATSEVFASGRQTLATSRKAMLIEAVRAGKMNWTPAGVEVIYSGLSSGIQHAVCVHRGDEAGWPDETAYLRAARREIAAAGLSPHWARDLVQRWRDTGSPYGVEEAKHDEGDKEGGAAPPASVLFLFDAATRAWQPQARATWLEVARLLEVQAVYVAKGSSGFELFDLGFVSEASQAAHALARTLEAIGSEIIVSDSPEAVYMLTNVWPQWGLQAGRPGTKVRHTTAWLSTALSERRVCMEPQGKAHTFQDPSYLTRYLGETEAPRSVLRRLGVRTVEMLRHGAEALPCGSFYGDAPGSWAARIAPDRAASAHAAGAEAIVTASPFDLHNLRDVYPTSDLGEVCRARLSGLTS